MRHLPLASAVVLTLFLLLATGCGPRSATDQEAPKDGESQTDIKEASLAPALRAKENVEMSSQKPLTYKDEKTEMLFYLEGNGANLAAIDKNGAILWYKDITKDVFRKSPPRGKELRITCLGKPYAETLANLKAQGKDGDYIEIGLNTSEAGLLNQKTGE